MHLNSLAKFLPIHPQRRRLDRGGDPVHATRDGTRDPIFELVRNDTLFGWNRYGGQRDNVMRGTDRRDALQGQGGDDKLNGGLGDDMLDGGDGDDLIVDIWGGNEIRGGAGDDEIHGRGVMEGGDGDDRITGIGRMAGGRGDDALVAASIESADTYVFNLGDGHDTIRDHGRNGLRDLLLFGSGILPARIKASRVGRHLVLRVEASDQITVEDWFAPQNGQSNHVIEQIRFADGTKWTPEQVARLVGADTGHPGGGDDQHNELRGDERDNEIYGLGGNDIIWGLGGNDKLYGGADDDRLYGGDGDDLLDGGDGRDRLYGGAGKDRLDGGAGDDQLFGGEGNDTIQDAQGTNHFEGGAGNDSIQGAGVFDGGTGDDDLIAARDDSDDVYRYRSGDGHDTITERGAGGGSRDDLLQFEGIASHQLWLYRLSDDLVFTPIGAGGSVTIKDWYVSTDRRIERIRAGDGAELSADRVQALVEAMAELSPPPPGQSVLPDATRKALEAVLSASWK